MYESSFKCMFRKIISELHIAQAENIILVCPESRVTVIIVSVTCGKARISCCFLRFVSPTPPDNFGELACSSIPIVRIVFESHCTCLSGSHCKKCEVFVLQCQVQTKSERSSRPSAFAQVYLIITIDYAITIDIFVF